MEWNEKLFPVWSILKYAPPTLIIPFPAAITSFPIKNEINEENKTERNSPSCRILVSLIVFLVNVLTNHKALKVSRSTKKSLLVFLIHVLLFL